MQFCPGGQKSSTIVEARFILTFAMRPPLFYVHYCHRLMLIFCILLVSRIIIMPHITLELQIILYTGETNIFMEEVKTRIGCHCIMVDVQMDDVQRSSYI